MLGTDLFNVCALTAIFASIFSYFIFRKKKGNKIGQSDKPTPKVEYPPFAGQLYEIADPVMRQTLKITRDGYVRLVRQLEQELGLGMNEPTPANCYMTSKLWDLRYRVILLTQMVNSGKVHTGDIYRVNATCGQPYFYPAIFECACNAVGHDISTATIDSVRC